MDLARDWKLDPLPNRLGRQVRVYARTDSTNQRALELSDEIANDGLVLIAEEQTAGRGQYGRVWQAPPRSSVLLSALVFPPPEIRRPALLTSLAAVAVTEVVRKVCHPQAKIKWPNDVYLHGKKICGILIEQRGVGNPNAPLAAVIGIGLNLHQSADDFRLADLPLAGSLASVSGVLADWQQTAESLIRTLDEAYGRLLEGDFNTLESLWKARLGLLGKNVTIELADRQIEGRLLDLAFDGVVVEGDELMSFPPEAIRHISAVQRES
ncbi:MAG: biotin--[acetyl-CoA-carboxylase] ligase [Gemmataceae bacterium]|nr:biotin--[acetyl-CoA-carboxylase] ligase [Gemmataceae bacterium]